MPRHPAIGGTGQILASGGASGGTLIGATIPFPVTQEARQATAAPRRCIAERYASRNDSWSRSDRRPPPQLVQVYLLKDVEEVVGQAAQHGFLCGK